MKKKSKLKNVKINRIFEYDFCISISRLRIRYLLVILTISFVSYMFVSFLEINSETLNYWDLIYKFFEGHIVYTKDRTSQFKLPILVIAFQLLMLFLIGSFARQDLCGYGQNMFIISGSRKKWWVSKTVWMLYNIFLYYIYFLLFMAILVIWKKGEFALETSYIFEITGKNYVNFIGILLGATFSMSTAMGMIQFLITMKMGALWGYIVSVLILVVSAYKMHPLLIGNYFMMLRYYYFCETGNMRLAQCICSACFIDMVSVVIGLHFVQHLDVIKIDES